ncbi:MAG: hypothetical protein ACOCVT_02820, partial [bacterium]
LSAKGAPDDRWESTKGVNGCKAPKALSIITIKQRLSAKGAPHNSLGFQPQEDKATKKEG